MQKLDQFRTVDELKDDPYPDNVVAVCAYMLGEEEIYIEGEETDTAAEDWITGGSDIAAASENLDDVITYTQLSYWPCEVTSRVKGDDGKDIYEVEIFQTTVPDADITVWHHNDYRRILQNCTKSCLKFINNLYSSDQHLSGVFRSPMRIPDNILPVQWKDIQ